MLVIPVYVYRNMHLHDVVIFGELLAVAVIYWIFTFIFSRVSLRLEERLGVGQR